MAKGKPKSTVGCGSAPAAKPAGGMAIKAGWPVHEVLLSRGWEKQGAAITLLIARRSPTSGKIDAAILLVDLACLGVKSAQVRLFRNGGEYSAGLRAHALRLQPMMPIDLNLAAKIVLTSLEYAGNLGFKPDPVYAQAAHLLADADPNSDPTPVPTGGPEGKPFYINGPHDDARKIVDHLTRTVGAGKFHYLIQGSKEALGLPDDSDEWFDDATGHLGI